MSSRSASISNIFCGPRGGRLPVWLGVRRRGTWAAATATSVGMRKPGGATSAFWPTTVASRFCPGWRCRTWPRTFSAASPSGCRRTGSASMGTPSIFWRPLWIRNGFAGPVTGRLTGADAAVVGGVHVADFEAGALAGQTAGTERRETPLVRDLRQRIGLIHELRELAGTEEFADGRHNGLGVHQVVRHGRGHFLVDGHLLFDGALHAHQADAELVFQQFAHGAHAAVAQVIDIVDRADALAQ